MNKDDKKADEEWERDEEEAIIRMRERLDLQKEAIAENAKADN